MAAHEYVARALASAFVCGRWETDELVEQGADALGKRWRWLRPLVGRLLLTVGAQRRPSRFRVMAFLRQDAGLRRACRENAVRVGGLQRHRPVMAPAGARPASWEVPPLVTVGELADWLDVLPEELDWFADRRHLERRRPAGPLRHYRYQWLEKRLGGTARLIESPKWRLKTVQRRVLREIVERIPPHEAAHGFCRGRSIRSFVAPHLGRSVVLKIDLQDFFPSISPPRVVAVFRTAGYPEDVAQTLAALCTNWVPDDVWRDFPARGGPRDRWRHEGLFGRPHLPQGAPTSPALANLCVYRLDCRLAGLAQSVGGHYTRYADDLLFSGDDALKRSVRRFSAAVGAIVREEGFAVNGHKTRIMRQASRQSAAGLVLNRHANVPRDEYDRLKATLHNCMRHGPSSQNRAGVPDFRAHLQGRVAFVESINPARGQRLRELLDRIEWRNE
jgi:RNA-directed DNA polymerase